MKFYAAEVILGLEHMHRRYIVYRDLKPVPATANTCLYHNTLLCRPTSCWTSTATSGYRTSASPVISGGSGCEGWQAGL